MTCVVRSSVVVLLAIQSATAVAAEKIPLNTFLMDMRNQLYAIAQTNDQGPVRAVIGNIHVEMNVVAEKDAQGRIRYFVVDGLVDQSNVVTQKISFDMQLQPDTSAADRPGSRAYSTRRRGDRYRPDRYYPATQYPPYPGHYVPDIYPLILMDKGVE